MTTAERIEKLKTALQLALFAAGSTLDNLEALCEREVLSLTLSTRAQLQMTRNQPTPKQLATAALVLAMREARAADMLGWNLGKATAWTAAKVVVEADRFARRVQEYIERGAPLRPPTDPEIAVECPYCHAMAGSHCRWDDLESGTGPGTGDIAPNHHTQRSAAHASWLEAQKACRRCGAPGHEREINVIFEGMEANDILRLCDECFNVGPTSPKPTTKPMASNLSWKPEVIADESGQWVGNALRFATKEEAEANVRDLSWRWMLVRETRVVESTDPVNYRWDFHTGLVRLAGAEIAL